MKIMKKMLNYTEKKTGDPVPGILLIILGPTLGLLLFFYFIFKTLGWHA